MPELTKEQFYAEIERHKSLSMNQPSLMEKAASLASSASDWARSGFKVVDQAILEDRLSICQQCEFWDKDAFAGTGKCQKCGCSTKAKLRMATSKCPIDKWMPVKIEQPQ
jgi:hypothetical protein